MVLFVQTAVHLLVRITFHRSGKARYKMYGSLDDYFDHINIPMYEEEGN
jgi:hypothetical protein